MPDIDYRHDTRATGFLWNREDYGDRCFYYDVFISHSSIDDPTEFVTALRRFGLRIWYDRYEPMDDANWLSRVYIALRNSRSLLVFAGAGPLEEHAWVRFEVATADMAAKKANVERVFVAVGNMGARIPSWLINRPAIFQLDSSNSEDDSIKNCADKLRELNRVQFD
jgi:TIR domain